MANLKILHFPDPISEPDIIMVLKYMLSLAFEEPIEDLYIEYTIDGFTHSVELGTLAGLS